MNLQVYIEPRSRPMAFGPKPSTPDSIAGFRVLGFRV